MSCHVMSMSCHVMSCHVMLCLAAVCCSNIADCIILVYLGAMPKGGQRGQVLHSVTNEPGHIKVKTVSQNGMPTRNYLILTQEVAGGPPRIQSASISEAAAMLLILAGVPLEQGFQGTGANPGE